MAKKTAKDKPVSSDTKLDLTKLNLFQRISGLRHQMKGIAADKTIDGQYDVTTHKAIIPVLRPLMVAYGLIDWMSQEAIVTEETGLVRGKSRQKLLQCLSP